AGIILTLLILMFVFCASDIFAGEKMPLTPSSKDKCPVCGMFVAKYPDFLAQIIFKDGTAFFFDGPKDMFKFYFNLQRYSPKKKLEDIDALYVTDYYSLLPIDGFTALYVTGSDVYGPMGRELIPFGKNQEALEFKRDHKGKEILNFQGITPAVVKGLD
ncbi:MAG: nitrous oxide reductase accessory protein NosL, partial [Deltaproteobacteria bacterium]|nr:nitrous oxide reductase accessory protein NosL [Deltaproteobacteria bacterium]